MIFLLDLALCGQRRFLKLRHLLRYSELRYMTTSDAKTKRKRSRFMGKELMHLGRYQRLRPPPHSSLKELQLFGFNGTEQHMAFIGAVMERASNLQAVVLKEHDCKSCDAVIIPNFVECGFPKNKGNKIR